jgi:O-antigen biosynthesis protein
MKLKKNNGSILVGIVIVNYNGKDFLRNCLESIKKNTSQINYKIVVVDNGSSKKELFFLRKNFKEVEVIKNSKNLGFPKANNQGCKFLLKKYDLSHLYFLNNDTLVTSGWLNEALLVSSKYNASMVASKQIDFEGNLCKTVGKIKFLGVSYYFGNKIKEVEWANGAALLVKKEVFRDVGFLNEIYSPAYYEETDFEKRARDKGHKIFYAPNSIVYHKGGATTSNNKSFYSSIFYRNRIIFFLKNYSVLFFLPRFFLDVSKSLIGGRFKNMFMAYREGLKLLKEEKFHKNEKNN